MTKNLLKAKEVATILKLNILTVYEYINKSELPAVKFGRSYRIEEKDLYKFIRNHKVKHE